MAGNWGGVRQGQGRKSKADELKLIDSLSVYDDKARDALFKGVLRGEFNYIKLFLEYRFGKPRQQIDVTSADESINRIMIVPELIATKLLNDIPDDLDKGSEGDK